MSGTWAAARNRYNKSVQEYNTTVRQFPTNLTAMLFRMDVKPNFAVANEAAVSAPPKVYSAPLLVNWSLNYSCNFSCEHCYSRLEQADELPTERALEAGRRLARAGVLFANFGGGEPLLRRDLLPLARELTALGLSLSLNSNGWLFDERAAAGLKEAGFASVGLSLDSHRPEVHDRFRNRAGSFDRVLAAAGHLVTEVSRLEPQPKFCPVQ